MRERWRSSSARTIGYKHSVNLTGFGMATFSVSEYSVSTIASSVGSDEWVGLYSISKIVDGEEQQIASLRSAPGSFTDMMCAISNADEAARAFIAGL